MCASRRASPASSGSSSPRRRGPDGAPKPAVLAACAIAGVDEVYAIGGAQAIAALRLRHRDDRRAVDVIAGPGNRYVKEAKRQLFGAVGIDGIAGPSELAIVADATADPDAIALDLCAQAEHGDDSSLLVISPSADVARRGRRARRGSSPPSAPSVADAAARAGRRSPASSAALELADAFAPEHLELAFDGADEIVARAAHRRLRLRRRRRRDRLRRLRRRLQPRAADRRRRALRRPARARAPSCAAPRSSTIPAAAAAGARADGRRARPRRGPSRCTASRRVAPGEPPKTERIEEPMAAPRRSNARPARPTSRSSSTWTAARSRPTTGVGFLDHMLDLLGRHGRLGLRVEAERRPRDRRPPHRRGRRHRARPGARPGARRPRRDPPLRLRRGADGRGARRVRDRHLGPPVLPVRGRPAAGLDRRASTPS